MENHATLLINTSFIAVCIAMGIVFISIPLPANKRLKKYRISLRILAGSYFLLALFKITTIFLQLSVVNLISIERLTISSLQATLFSLALITLLKPHFITIQFLYSQIIPVLVLNILYITVASGWGNPIVPNYPSLNKMALSAPVLVRELFVLFYIVQLIYLSWLFFQKYRNYGKEINNYFSVNDNLKLKWVKYCFYAAMLIGISALISCFIQTETLLLLFNSAYTLFYLIFGICYIQYPKTYIYIEPVLYHEVGKNEELTKFNKRLVWSELKYIIIAEKYFLQPEVNIEDMARYLKIGRTTLSKFINKEEGMNFNSWINILRIEEAKDLLLKYPESTLTDISEKVGYSESSNFSRQFKLITNVSPSVWRQNSR